MIDIVSVPKNLVYSKTVCINEPLRLARLQRCWTIAEAAETVGVSYETFYRWEHYLQHPRLHGLRHLQQTFGRSAEELGFEYLITLEVVVAGGEGISEI